MSTIGTRKNRDERPPHSSLNAQLVRQVRYLKNSADLFDAGDHEEAVRLAATMRVLLHDGNDKSLLTLLGVRDTLAFVDTGLYRPRLNAAVQEWLGTPNVGIAIGEAGLVELHQVGNMAGWCAPLREHRFPQGDHRLAAMQPPQPFQAWWETPLVENSQLKLFSRENLVLIMANQDGGAHVDPTLDRDYAALCTDHLGTSVEYGPSRMADPTWAPPSALYNVAFASVRQIAFEVMLSIERSGVLS